MSDLPDPAANESRIAIIGAGMLGLTAFPFAELVSTWHDLAEVEALVRNGLPPSQVRLGVKP